jgi:hypothetical protein
MALYLGQRVIGTGITFVCTMPPGPARLTLVAGTAAIAVTAVPLGGSVPGTTFTVTTGALIPASTSVTYAGQPGSTGADIYAISGAATSASYHTVTTG